jgi:hypothetical protein
MYTSYDYIVDDILNANDKLLNIVEEYILWLKLIKVIILIHPPLSIPTFLPHITNDQQQ